jgi:hypothetical protein
MNPFPVAWDELDLPTIEAYLATAEREPLTWEAKGNRVTPPQADHLEERRRVREHGTGWVLAPWR